MLIATEYFQCTFQMDSNSSALELLTSDLTNKDEAFSINKATRNINKNSKSLKDMVSLPDIFSNIKYFFSVDNIIVSNIFIENGQKCRRSI